MSEPQLLIASKSRWDPPIRREHALARLAAGVGWQVSFIEQPEDIRALAGRHARTWLGSLVAPTARPVQPGVETIPRGTVARAHRGRLLETLDNTLLGRAVHNAIKGTDSAILVATLPWQWVAIGGIDAHRRVLDVADDWAALIPGAERRVRALYARAQEEADAIVVASERLGELFRDRPVSVVRNGTDEQLLAAPLTPPPGAKRLVYVGTLSERFDAPLVGRLLDQLAGWTLELYGACAYAGKQRAPGDELAELLARVDGRARWHGPVARAELSAVLDRADVLLLPNRQLHSRGQDSMKVYDYAARGRPILATEAAAEGSAGLPPRTYLASDAPELARAAQDAVEEPPEWVQERSAWAARHSWASRWPDWSRVLRGNSAEGDISRAPHLNGTAGGTTESPHEVGFDANGVAGGDAQGAAPLVRSRD